MYWLLVRIYRVWWMDSQGVVYIWKVLIFMDGHQWFMMMSPCLHLIGRLAAIMDQCWLSMDICTWQGGAQLILGLPEGQSYSCVTFFDVHDVT